MFWQKREQLYINEIKGLCKELSEKNDSILELLEREKELHQEIYDKNTEILELMKMTMELRMDKSAELNKNNTKNET